MYKKTAHVNTRMNFLGWKDQKINPDQHSFAIRAEEHTAQVNDKDSSINEGISRKQNMS